MSSLTYYVGGKRRLRLGRKVLDQIRYALQIQQKSAQRYRELDWPYQGIPDRARSLALRKRCHCHVPAEPDQCQAIGGEQNKCNHVAGAAAMPPKKRVDNIHGHVTPVKQGIAASQHIDEPGDVGHGLVSPQRWCIEYAASDDFTCNDEDHEQDQEAGKPAYPLVHTSNYVYE